MSRDLELIYSKRFEKSEAVREKVWSVLVEHHFQQWIRETDVVLDLGAGYCEFINCVRAGRKFAMDLNPATLTRASHDVTVIPQDVTSAWNLPSASLDLIFSSNFLEHLPSKSTLQFCLSECQRVLRPGGKLLLLGPNIRFCPDLYWDFFDHNVPLSDRSVVEALELCGFKAEKVVPRFLPFTMKGKDPHPGLVRLYLKLPLFWTLLGKQFFIVASKA